MSALSKILAALGREWYAFDILSHNRVGPFWSQRKAAEVSSDLQEELMWADSAAGVWKANSGRWIAVSTRWMQRTGVL